ncbi:MAG: CRISPR-associated endonuclease Cas1 [Tessaracoccus sp.]
MLTMEMFAVDAFRRAWEQVVENDAEDGVMSWGVERFAEEADESLERLSTELREGAYVPSDLTRVSIQVGAKLRQLDIPPVRDRIVERSILDGITSSIDPLLGSASYGYRPGLGVRDAVDELIALREEGFTHVLRSDVRDCFPSLPVDLIRRKLQALLEPELLQIVYALLNRCSTSQRGKRRAFPGLPQGSALSPLFANLVLVELDEALQQEGFPIIRYADDFAIAVDSPADGREAQRVATAKLKELGMELGAEKTAVMSFDEGFAFLGVDFGPRYPPPLDAGAVEPDRKVLYVGKQGSRIRVSSGRVIVEKNDTQLLSVPVTEVSRVVCFGSVAISAGARSWALGSDIDVVLASRRGNYQGAIVNDRWPARASRVRAQLGLMGTDREIQLARKVVAAKIGHQVTVLRKFGRRQHADEIKSTVHHIKQLERMIPDANNRDELMGLEGAAAKVYWPQVGRLMPEGMGFTLRSRQPPMDVPNAALSYLYTILLGECITALHASGLDPDLGVLHAQNDRRPSLALDLMEEFRPLIVDRIVLETARRKQLGPNHGREITGKSGVYLTAAGREAVTTAYESRMLSSVGQAIPGFAGSWRRHIYRQAQRLRAAIMDPTMEWSGVTWR